EWGEASTIPVHDGAPRSVVVVHLQVDRCFELSADTRRLLLHAVEVQGEIGEPHLLQAGLHHVEGRLLLGHEQDGFALEEAVGDEIGDGLGFAGSGWALENECAALPGSDDGPHLSTVGRDRQRQPIFAYLDVAQIRVIDRIAERCSGLLYEMSEYGRPIEG